jgi:hypothetical protein
MPTAIMSDLFTWDPTRQVYMSTDETVLVHRLVCGKWSVREGDVTIAYSRTSEGALKKAERWLKTRLDVANVQQV